MFPVLLLGDSIFKQVRIDNVWVNARGGTYARTYPLPDTLFKNDYKKCIVALGGNDLSNGDKPQEVFESITRLVGKVRYIFANF